MYRCDLLCSDADEEDGTGDDHEDAHLITNEVIILIAIAVDDHC